MNNSGFFREQKVFFGDIHNHCGVSYGHGPLVDAIYNASLQLDFTSITGHAAWPDMDEKFVPPEVIQYHQEGFDRLRKNRLWYAQTMENANNPGKFLTFGSYELHSFRYGDYTVLQRDALQEHILPSSGDGMRKLIDEASAERDGIILMPHHIGYKTGFRGIDWGRFNPQASPLVEIISMHGCAESENSTFPYLHTMGPLDDTNTMQTGLNRGNIFGVTGSTDHHSAHPGSYGYGKTAVWAQELSRVAIWQAFLERRTYAVSGDKIICSFAVNGEPMGGIVRDSENARVIEFAVRGGDALSRVEIIKNNRVWYQKNYILEYPNTAERIEYRGKILIELGWGEKHKAHEWNVDILLNGLHRLSLEPRFRGIDVVDPLDETGGKFSFTRMEEISEKHLHLETMTFGNATTGTSQTQGLVIEVEGSKDGEILIIINSAKHRINIQQLLNSGVVFYSGGFLSTALKIHQFIPEIQYVDEFSLEDPEKKRGDFYYARVFQRNQQAAWTSPIKFL